MVRDAVYSELQGTIHDLTAQLEATKEALKVSEHSVGALPETNYCVYCEGSWQHVVRASCNQLRFANSQPGSIQVYGCTAVTLHVLGWVLGEDWVLLQGR